jgi:alpha-ketoglutarate-dependent taurine dioxygenase
MRILKTFLPLANLQAAIALAPLGAIVTDLDASQAIAPEVILQLKEALRDRHILIFKDQKLSDEQLLNFALYFGALFVPSDETPVLASKPVGCVMPQANAPWIVDGALAYGITHPTLKSLKGLPRNKLSNLVGWTSCLPHKK